MGWTTTQKPSNVKQYMDNLYTFNGSKVLRSAIVNFNEYYAAVQMPDGRVWCGVAMLRFYRGDYYDFGYKDMDETVGPCCYNCPESILDLLTEAPEGYAAAWREENRKSHNARRAATKVRQSLKEGDRVRCGGNEYEVVMLMRWHRGKLVAKPYFRRDGAVYRIPRGWTIEKIEEGLTATA